MTEQPDRRRRRWEETHQRIQDTAIRLIREHGFDRVSVGQIAAGAEVSVPTFYAHYPSKEHLLMRLPSLEQIAAVAGAVPAGLPLVERLTAVVGLYLARGRWTQDFRESMLTRWQIVAGEPALRTRAAEFERTAAQYLAAALRTESGHPLGLADVVVVNAYMSAYTTGLLAWAETDGSRDLLDHIGEALEALRRF